MIFYAKNFVFCELINLKEKQWYANKIKNTKFFSCSLKTSIVNLVERTCLFKMQIPYYYLAKQTTNNGLSSHYSSYQKSS
jgi:hypothetical protein